MKAIDRGPVNPESVGDQRLYVLDPPIKTDDGEDVATVVVSAANVPYSGIETYIFAANYSGEITDWSELEGSQRGTLSHDQVLRDLGYEVVPS